MSGPNPYVSNGTCYGAPGSTLDKSFIPCGNTAFGFQTCCGAGNTCLADNACFGYYGSGGTDGSGSYLTYIAGCTDPSYGDETVCPQKEIAGQAWIGLVLCDNSNGVWAECVQYGSPFTLEAGSPCTCTNAASAKVAFSDAATLSNVASLPLSTGGTISFYAGKSPSSVLTTPTPPPSTSSSITTTSSSSSKSSSTTSSSTSTTSSTSTISSSSTPSPTSSSTSTTPTSSSSTTQSSPSSITTFTSSSSTLTSTTSSSSSPTAAGASSSPTSAPTPSGLSTGAKIGIGVGAGLGAIALLVLLLFFLLRRRRRSKTPRQKIESSLYESAASPVPSKPAPKHEVEPPETGTSMFTTPLPRYNDHSNGIAEADSRPATNPWPHRNELEGSSVPYESTRKPGPPREMAELPGSGVGGLSREATLQSQRERLLAVNPDNSVGGSSATRGYMQGSSSPT